MRLSKAADISSENFAVAKDVSFSCGKRLRLRRINTLRQPNIKLLGQKGYVKLVRKYGRVERRTHIGVLIGA